MSVNLDDDLGPAAALDRVAAEAADVLIAEVLQRYPTLLSSRDPQAMLRVRAELLFHVGALSASLALPEPGCLCTYARWLASVLAARGVAVQVLEDMVAALADFLRLRLQPAALEPVLKMLGEGMVSLTTRGEIPLFHRLLPTAVAGVDELAESVLAGDTDAARVVLQAALQPPEDYLAAAAHLIQPALYRIGYWWERKVVTPGQEHLASELLTTLLSDLFVTAKAAPSCGRKVLLAGVEDNHHVLGLRMVGDAFRLGGWSVQFLGANTPTPSVLRQVDMWRPEVVGLSAAMVQNLPTLRSAADALRSNFASFHPGLMVGGLATNQHDEIWRRVGADLWFPDVEAAATFARGR